jgi:crossover junction endodeoxyribonuclease RusA
MHTVELPWPPSVNKMYESRGYGGQRRLATAAVMYRSVVAVRCRDARRSGVLPKAPLQQRLQVTIHFHPPDQAVRDLDNFNKAPLDALTHAGAWADDGQIDRLIIDRAGVRAGGVLVVVIEDKPPRETDRLRPLFQAYRGKRTTAAVCKAFSLPYVEVAAWLAKGHDLSDALCQRMRGDLGLGAP